MYFWFSQMTKGIGMLYFRHTYRTMNGQAPGKDGLPGNYKMVDLNEIQFYDLESDISESKNVVASYPMY